MAKLFLRKMEMGRKKLQVDKMKMDMQKRSVSPHTHPFMPAHRVTNIYHLPRQLH